MNDKFRETNAQIGVPFRPSSDLLVDAVDGNRYIVRKRFDGQVGIIKAWYQPEPPHDMNDSHAELDGVKVYPTPALSGDAVSVIGQKVFISRIGLDTLRRANHLSDVPTVFANRLAEAIFQARNAQYTVDDSVTKLIQNMGKKS